MHAPRGQVSAEFFLLLALFAIAFLWFANYLNEATASADARVVTLQRGVARSLADHVNSVCASQANLTAEVPCLAQGTSAFAYRADFAGATVTVQSDQTGFSVNASSACNATGTVFASACSGAGNQSACFAWSNGILNVTNGACPA